MIRSRRTEVEMSLRDLAKFSGIPPRLAAYEQASGRSRSPSSSDLHCRSTAIWLLSGTRSGPVGEWQATQEAFEVSECRPTCASSSARRRMSRTCAWLSA
jgi:hypothetical protein